MVVLGSVVRIFVVYIYAYYHKCCDEKNNCYGNTYSNTVLVN